MQTHLPGRKKSMVWAFFAIGAALCWGLYGPTLFKGQMALQKDPFKALLCVGAAYFLIGVLVPLGALGSRGMTGFSQKGVTFALIGGALGALGAICIILAFKNQGVPTYVMPIVFGGAPVVNVLFSMYLDPPHTDVNPLLWVGMVLVPIGAGLVLYYKPH
ncbi:MAG TPA: hypothetical protein VGP79_10970 [Bryobacteraceae bacterium]|jgi:uncharacterized membrane protein|nr:hypothetical protein [Bryobacteraceae bacterium]